MENISIYQDNFERVDVQDRGLFSTLLNDSTNEYNFSKYLDFTPYNVNQEIRSNCAQSFVTSRRNMNPRIPYEQIKEVKRKQSSYVSASSSNIDDRTFQCSYANCGKIYAKSSHLKVRLFIYIFIEPFDL